MEDIYRGRDAAGGNGKENVRGGTEGLVHDPEETGMPIRHKECLKSDSGICKNEFRRGEDTSLEPGCKDS